jgi:tetraprenyl-beta-curcumene synthase
MYRRSTCARPHDPAPPSTAQLAALARVACRELTWGLPLAAAEIRRCKRRATAIPDPRLRADAIHGLTAKRPHLDGAALFAALPRTRSPALLRALLRFEAILEYLDNTHERASETGIENGMQLHAALVDALDQQTTTGRAYYRSHPWGDDAGYLEALVASCRTAASSLPSYPAIREPLLEHAQRLAHVLPLNHEPDPARRAVGLRRWATLQSDGDWQWFERTAADTGSLVVHGLLALAAEPTVGDPEIARTLALHRRLSLAATMLDSYVDQRQDALAGRHSYVAYYGDSDTMSSRLGELITECLSVAGTLPNARQTNVLIASMVALYLSSDSSRSPTLARSTRMLLRSGGSLTILLAPVLRAWRIAYGLTGA